MGNSCNGVQKSTVMVPSRVIQVQRRDFLATEPKRHSLRLGLTPNSSHKGESQTRASSRERAARFEIQPSLEVDDEIKTSSTFRAPPLKYDLSELKIGEYYLEKELAEMTNKFSETNKKRSMKNNLKWEHVVVEFRDKLIKTPKGDSLYTDIDLCFREFALSKSKSFDKMSKKGVPMRYRWSLWKNYVDIDKFYVPNLYEKFKGLSSKWEIDIRKDLHRTFPSEPYFAADKYEKIGQEQLFNVLKAISLYFPNVGYAQSMNFLAGFLLIVSGGRELESFWMFVTLARDHNFLMMGLFEKGFPLMEFYTYVFYEILQEEAPVLAEHLKQQQIPDMLWLFKWFLTMFLYSFPPKYVIKIWDYVMMHGLFALVQIAIGIVKFLESDMLTLDSIGIDLLFKYLKGEPPKAFSQILQENNERMAPEAQIPVLQKKGTIIVNHMSVADLENHPSFQDCPEESDSEIQYNCQEFNIDQILEIADKVPLSPEKISQYVLQYSGKSEKKLPEVYTKFFCEWYAYAPESTKFEEFQVNIDYHLIKTELFTELTEQIEEKRPSNEVVVTFLDEDDKTFLKSKIFERC